jgi:hypothetical protein
MSRSPHEAYPVSRAAHDPMEDDEVGRSHSLGMLEDVGYAKRAPGFDAKLPGQFQSVGTIRRYKLDDLSASSPSCEQLRLNSSDASADLEHSSASDGATRNTRDHLPLELV